jgi:hypothetical protein
MEQLALAWGPVRKTFTVAELNARIRGLGNYEPLSVGNVWTPPYVNTPLLASMKAI